MEITVGRSLTSEQKALFDEVIGLAREFVELVKKGKIRLERSKLLGETIYLSSGERYVVVCLDPFRIGTLEFVDEPGKEEWAIKVDTFQILIDFFNREIAASKKE